MPLCRCYPFFHIGHQPKYLRVCVVFLTCLFSWSHKLNFRLPCLSKYCIYIFLSSLLFVILSIPVFFCLSVSLMTVFILIQSFCLSVFLSSLNFFKLSKGRNLYKLCFLPSLISTYNMCILHLLDWM